MQRRALWVWAQRPQVPADALEMKRTSSVAQLLKHIFRINGTLSLWHIFLLFSFSFALGGYIGSGIKQTYHGWMFLIYAAPGLVLGFFCVALVGVVDYFIIRKLYFHFDAALNEKWRDKMMTISLIFSFTWACISLVLGIALAQFIVSYSGVRI